MMGPAHQLDGQRHSLPRVLERWSACLETLEPDRGVPIAPIAIASSGQAKEISHLTRSGAALSESAKSPFAEIGPGVASVSRSWSLP
jgi:hypothetical protein